MNHIAEENNNLNMSLQGATTSVMAGYFYAQYAQMLPWFAVAIPLILLDLKLGRARAKKKWRAGNGDRVTLNKSVKMTIDKTFSYICWIMLATTLAFAFDSPVIKIVIMAIVYGLEVASCITHWIELRYNVDVDFPRLIVMFCSWVWKRATGIEGNFESIITEIKKKENDS